MKSPRNTRTVKEPSRVVVVGDTIISEQGLAAIIGRDLPPGLDVLSNREMTVFSLIAAGHGTTQIAKELGISRKTVETHCEHLKLKLGYPDAEALRRGAREIARHS